MKAEIENLAQPGFVADTPDMLLPAGGWSDSRNVRYRDGCVEKCRGYEQAFGSLSATAIWATQIQDGTNQYLVYASSSVLFATDGLLHANVSHPSISFQATEDLAWNGGPFHGFVIANDGTNVPQSWNPSLSNDFTSLTAWPSISAKVLRPFKDFLFAFRITDGSDVNPRLMRWSDRAAQGALPQSWDFQDPTNQAGINELGQTPDSIVDALPLRDSLIIYKERHTWLGDYIGGLDIFGFRQIFSEMGMLTESCAMVFGSQHLVLTDNDWVLHEGNSAQSILDKRARRWLFGRINTDRYKRCYVVADYRNREAYACFPEAGNDWPNMALVWNWAENTLHPVELGGQKTFALSAIVGGVSGSFDSDTGTFDEDSLPFDEETFTPFQSRLVYLDATAQKAYQNDTGETFDGSPMTCYADRTGMAITKDLMMIKRIRRIFPRVIGTAGDEIRFFIGVRPTINATSEMRGPYVFRIGVDYKIDIRVSGRLLDLRVEYSGSNAFRMHGFSVEYDNGGYR